MSVSRPERWVAVVLLAVATSACASRGSTTLFNSRGASGNEDVILTVQNMNFNDATIYAHWSGMRSRVGVVLGKGTETFNIEWRSEEVRLEVDFLAGGSFWSESIAVWEGDHLEFIIPVGD